MRISDWSSDVCSSDLEGINITAHNSYNGGRLNLANVMDGFKGREHSDPWVGKLYSDVTSLYAKSGTWYTPTPLLRHGGPKNWAEQEVSEPTSENKDNTDASDKEDHKNKAMEKIDHV